MKAVIRVSGDWCNGYWWEIISSVTGHKIKESGPYHPSRLENARQVAYEDAEDYANRNDIEIIRYA